MKKVIRKDTMSRFIPILNEFNISFSQEELSDECVTVIVDGMNGKEFSALLHMLDCNTEGPIPEMPWRIAANASYKKKYIGNRAFVLSDDALDDYITNK